MCKFTLEKSKSFENLKAALEKIKVINNVINLRKKEADNRKKIMEIRKALRFKKESQSFDLLVPGRLFVREGKKENFSFFVNFALFFFIRKFGCGD